MEPVVKFGQGQGPGKQVALKAGALLCAKRLVLGEGQPGPYFHQYGTDIRETHCEIAYHAPARLDELITIAARVSRFGRTSFTLHCAIFRGAERLTDIEISYAHLDLDTGKPTALPGSFIAEVRRFETRLPVQD